jgi:hypothetical protein
VRLVGLQLLSGCVDLGLRCLALRIECAALGGLEPRLRDVQVVLSRCQLALGLVVGRLQLSTLRLDAAV